MDLPEALLIAVALVTLVTLVGVFARFRSGRKRTVSDAGMSAYVGPHLRGSDADITLVQFSTVTCARCPAARRLLADVAAADPRIAHVDVDVSDRADLISRYRLRQTPTVLVADRSGRVHARFSGVPRPQELHAVLDSRLRRPQHV